MRTLIAYQTKMGATAEYASTIGGVLTGEFGHEVDIVDLKAQKKVDIEPYDVVLVGTGIRMGRAYGRPKKLLRNKGLAAKRVYVFLSSGEAGQDAAAATEKYGGKFRRSFPHLIGLELAAFGGIMPAGAGDFRNPEAAKEWAKRVGESLKG